MIFWSPIFDGPKVLTKIGISKRQAAGAALYELHKILLTPDESGVYYDTSYKFIYTVFRNIPYESCRTL